MLWVCGANVFTILLINNNEDIWELYFPSEDFFTEYCWIYFGIHSVDDFCNIQDIIFDQILGPISNRRRHPGGKRRCPLSNERRHR